QKPRKIMFIVGAVISTLALPVFLWGGYKFHRKQYFLSEKKRVRTEYAAHIYTSPDHNFSLPYRLFLPQGYSNSREYPMVLLLHRGGLGGDDNLQQITGGAVWLASRRLQEKYPAIIVVPQCPEEKKWMDKPFKGLPYRNHNQDLYPESTIEKVLVKLVKKISNTYSVDSRRIYIAGYSMGATGVWDIITRHPSIFAAAIVISGENDPSKAHRLVNMPIWAFHGARDDVALADNSREMVNAIRKLGGKKIKYTEYTFSGHGIEWYAYLDEEVMEWFWSQRLKE
ncbi:MAG: dienelactone hydrolase family protein, partial [Deltaproteobacteria bacterium]|nr:dienelactone hydrolase family protein [Deltaproteobacteria bacterium]